MNNDAYNEDYIDLSAIGYEPNSKKEEMTDFTEMEPNFITEARVRNTVKPDITEERAKIDAAMNKWAKAQAKKKAPFRHLFLIAILIGVVWFALSIWNPVVYGATAYMEFKIVEINDDTVIAKNINGDAFVFVRPDFKLKLGIRVVVRTDFEYQGDDIWVWDRELTGIISREK